MQTDRILCLGDSHAALMVKAIREMTCGIQAFGGAMPFSPSDGFELFQYEAGCLRFIAPAVQARFRDYTRAAGAETGNLLDVEVPMVFSAFGTQVLARYPEWRHFSPFGRTGSQYVSRQMFEEIVFGFYRRLLPFFDHLAAGGRRFAYLIGPGMRAVDTHQGEVFLAIRETLLAALAERGVPAIDVTKETCDRHGMLREDFFPEDPEDLVHGNGAWTALAAEACFREFGMVPAGMAPQLGG